METDNNEDSERNTKISDSAYSNSGSNSQSRRSRSSKSTNSGSRSSGSSGYGGNPSTSTESSDKTNPSFTRSKDKGAKKKKFKLPFKIHLENESERDAIAKQTAMAYLEEKVCVLSTSDDKETAAKCMSKDITAAIDHIDEDGFSAVISMADGVVMYTTGSITTALGFPKEIWIGRQFIDFIHPKDRETFSAQAMPEPEIKMPSADKSAYKKSTLASTKCSLFCRLRRYIVGPTLPKDQQFSYTTFQLQMSYRDISEASKGGVFIVIHAAPVLGAYKVPNEKMKKATPFMTRHLADGSVEYVDSESVAYLGYLPQDIVGSSAIDLYHPDDLTYLTQVYENIVKEGNYFNKAPYRFLIQNGFYIHLETSWSSFINPWSRKLEFVIGHHKVIEGPSNTDVFLIDSTASRFSCETNQRSKLFRDNILRILREEPTKEYNAVSEIKSFSDVPCDLTNYDTGKPDEELKVDIQQETEQSPSERDSVMLGGISPHHDYFDSKSSTETPPSYNQLNYNDNIQRYFESDLPLKTATHDFDLLIEDGECDQTRNASESNHMEPMESSPDNCSNQRYEKEPSVEGNFTSNLSEALLTKHNYAMEKMLIKRHREARSVSKASERGKNSDKRVQKKHLGRRNTEYQQTGSQGNELEQHGVKRSGSISWDNGDVYKASKNSHTATIHANQMQNGMNGYAQTMWDGVTQPFGMPHYGPNALPNLQHGQLPMTPLRGSPYPGLMPVFYVATPPPPPQSHDIHSTPGQEMQQEGANGDNNNGAQNNFACHNNNSGHNQFITQNNFAGHKYAPVPYMLYSPTMYGPPMAYAPIQFAGIHNNDNNEANININNPAYTQYQTTCQHRTVASMQASDSTSRNSPASGSNRNEFMKMPTGRPQRTMTTAFKKMKTKRFQRSMNGSQDLGSSGASSKYMKSSCNTNEDSGSTGSSFYSSFIKTDSGSGEGDNGQAHKNNPAKKKKFDNDVNKPSTSGSKAVVPKRKIEPPWNQQVCVTSELIYKYRVLAKNLEEVLNADLGVLNTLTQPPMVEEQLTQLYVEMETEGLPTDLALDEGFTSSSGSSGEESSSNSSNQHKKRKRQYSRFVMIYEEDAPFPPDRSD